MTVNDGIAWLRKSVENLIDHDSNGLTYLFDYKGKLVRVVLKIETTTRNEDGR